MRYVLIAALALLPVALGDGPACDDFNARHASGERPNVPLPATPDEATNDDVCRVARILGGLPTEEQLRMVLAAPVVPNATALPTKTERGPLFAPFNPAPGPVVPDVVEDPNWLIATSGFCSSLNVVMKERDIVNDDAPGNIVEHFVADISFNYYPQTAVKFTDFPYHKANAIEGDQNEADALVSPAWDHKNIALLEPTSTCSADEQTSQAWGISVFKVEEHRACSDDETAWEGHPCVHFTGYVSAETSNFDNVNTERFVCQLFVDSSTSWNSGSCCGPDDQTQTITYEERSRAAHAHPGLLPAIHHDTTRLHGPCTGACASCSLFSPGGCCSTHIGDYVQCAEGEYCMRGARNTCVKLADAKQRLQMRVTKRLGKHGYAAARVSLISIAGTETQGFSYAEDFKLSTWSQFKLSSSVVSTPSNGGDTTFSFTESGESRSVSFYTPAKGEGVAGILIADPCINEGMGKLFGFCTLWDTFNTIETIPGLLNAFMGRTDHSRIHFWGTLGDNWYDSNGQGSFPGEPDLSWTTETNGGNIMTIYDQLSDDVLSTYQLMVPGNHDLWDYGVPGIVTNSESDNGGWGHAQYYAMDTMASTEESPFLWSPEPNGKGWSRVAPSDNFNFYHQMGNLGLVRHLCREPPPPPTHTRFTPPPLSLTPPRNAASLRLASTAAWRAALQRSRASSRKLAPSWLSRTT